MKSKFFKNIISGFAGQLIAILLGIIVPRFFITNYGSDVNGLLSTITQIFTYMALLEAGIGSAAKNLMFKPFQENDRDGVSEIASITRAYFQKFTIIYAIGVILLALVLPFVLKTNVDSLTISLIVLFEGLSGVISFYYIQTPSIIIGVDGRSYVNNGITLLNKIVGYIVKIVMATFGINIVLLQFAFFIVSIFKVVFYKNYFKKHYKWIDLHKKNIHTTKLKDRNSYIIIEICWTVFSSTDMIILSTLVSTQLSSVYSIYNMIFLNVSLLINAVFTSVTYLLGHTYHESREKYIKLHDAYNSIFFGIMTSAMIVCNLLAIPFIALYTKGVKDVNYIYPALPLMFCLVQLLSWSRYVSGNLIGVAGRTKKAVWVNIAEALINFVCSILFVQKFGIIGVLFATVIALPVKLIYCNYIGDKIILNRNCNNTIKILGVNFALFFLSAFLKRFINIEVDSFITFLIYGIVISITSFAIVISVNLLINPVMKKIMINICRRRRLI